MKNHYKKKVEITGDIIKITESAEPIFCGFSSLGGRGGKKDKVTTEEEKQQNKNKTAKRRRSDFIDLVNCNFNNKNSRFMTLTFKENLTDLDISNKHFDKFYKRLMRYLEKENPYDRQHFRMLGVIEFQKNGSVHYHLLYNCFLPQKEVLKLWIKDIPYSGFRCDSEGKEKKNGGYTINVSKKVVPLGSVRLNKVDNVDNLGIYLVKGYMSKGLGDERLEGKKAYIRRGDLKEKEVIKEFQHEYNDIMEKLEEHINDENLLKEFSYEYKQGEEVKNSFLTKVYNKNELFKKHKKEGFKKK